MIKVRNHRDSIASGDRATHATGLFGISVPAWFEQALCAQTDPEAFFPDKGGSTREAKAICANCDVRAECLDYALINVERFGIWGGVSERERRHIFGELVDDDTEPLESAFDCDFDFIQDIPQQIGEAS